MNDVWQIAAAITPLLLVAYYLRQLFVPPKDRRDAPMPRSEVEMELKRVDAGLEGVRRQLDSLSEKTDLRIEGLLRALGELKVQIAKLTALLEHRLIALVRKDDKDATA